MTIYPEIPVTVDAEGIEFYEAFLVPRLRAHLVGIGAGGMLADSGSFKTSEDDVAAIFTKFIPETTKGWDKPIKLMFYAHGGLLEDRQSIINLWNIRNTCLSKNIYPIFFLWQTGLMTVLADRSQKAKEEEQNKGTLKRDALVTEFTDGTLEILFRKDFLNVRSYWNEVKNKAKGASATAGGGHLVIQHLKKSLPESSIHLVGHSAGGNFQVYFSKALHDHKLKIASCSLWGPACSIAVAEQTFLSVIKENGIGSFALYTLTDQAEREDNCQFYRKSILFLVSNALEAPGENKLLGMARHVGENKALMELFRNNEQHAWITAPNYADLSKPLYSSSSITHGGFDDDIATIQSTLARILTTT